MTDVTASTTADQLLTVTLPPSLSEEERRLLAELLNRLRQGATGQVERVILFGSRARGDTWEWSDFDLLVVSDLGRDPLYKILRGLETENGLSLLPLSMSLDEFRWYQRLRMPLYVNLCRDGIKLWDDTDWEAERLAVIADFSKEGEPREMSPETKETIAVYIEESRRCLKAMRLIEQGGFVDYAVSRGYYAAFNALSAALYALNVVRGSHSALKSAVSQFLVQPGLIEAEYKDIYERLYKGREWGDYKKRDVNWTDEQLRQLLNEAERFVARMESFLKEKQALD